MNHDRQQERPLHILLVEDNEADARFFHEVLKSVPLPTTVQVVDDGQLALAFLRKQQEYAHAPTPEVVFLDTLLPILSGAEVLVAMKQDEALAQIPVWLFVLGVHDLSLTQLASCEVQIEGWLTKPVEATQLTAILRTVRSHTVGASTLQTRRSGERVVQDSSWS